MSTNFIGRKYEYALLKGLQDKDTSSLAVIYGRRRIGKSRLIEEFGVNSGGQFYKFMGLYPDEGTTQQDQLESFFNRFLSYFDYDGNCFKDWDDAFLALARQTSKGKVIILLDEISWMGNRDKSFLGKLKSAWDLEFKNNPNLILVLCGSVSSWIESKLLANRGFYGRVSLKIQLKELSLYECNQFWETKRSTISKYDRLKILAVTGGIPRYLEDVNPRLSADENIKRLCFDQTGLLFNDYDYIFSSMLEHSTAFYQQVVEVLCHGSMQLQEILNKLDRERGGLTSQYLRELEVAGIITKDTTWNLKTGNLSRLAKYRLSDNYIRFYLKYILPILPKIKEGRFDLYSLSSLPGWQSIMGIQIESLVLNNRKELQKAIGVAQDEVLCDGSFFQRKTARTKGCQIDYLIQTKSNILYLCEIKFVRNVLRVDVIESVKEKIKRLSVPRNTSIIPILAHIGDVHDDVIDSQFFGKIVDLATLLDK